MGETFSTNLSSCDLAVPGSPSMRTLMSPRRRMPSGRTFFEPPMRRQVIDFLMSAGGEEGEYERRKGRREHEPVLPKIEGAILLENFS